MSNKKNDIIDTDFEEKLAEIVGKKSRSRTNNNIYERFINRVENSDEDYDDSLETVDESDSEQKLSTYAPLDAHERNVSYNRNEDEDNEVGLELIDASFDFSDSDQVASIIRERTNTSFKDSDLDDGTFGLDFDLFNDDIKDSNQVPEPIALSNADETLHLHDVKNTDSKLIAQDLSTQPANQEADLAQHKLASSKKLLIIGMLLGSLLIGIVVAVLIFTGVLSPSAQSNPSDAADTITSSEVEVQATTKSTADVSTVSAPTAVDNMPSTDTSPINPPAATSQQASPTSENQGVTANNGAEAPETTATLDAVSNTEPAITYEDFREESQITVYRETDD